jgi:hypothetical protein
MVDLLFVTDLFFNFNLIYHDGAHPLVTQWRIE